MESGLGKENSEEKKREKLWLGKVKLGYKAWRQPLLFFFLILKKGIENNK